MKLRCRHCARRPATRARRLCYACYHEPVIRNRFPPQTTNRPKNSTRDRKLARIPTPALPGSEEKLLVMIHRYARKEQLFHPRDAWE